MDYSLFWTEPALDEFESIITHLAAPSPQGAETVRVSILEHVELLRRFPEIGPVYERESSGRTREIICKGYGSFIKSMNRRNG
jgi:plasmid stabilization system protein ParE